jgi:hypothetical protein
MAATVSCASSAPGRGNVVTTNEIKNVLLWCVGLNYLVLILWAGLFVFAHDWMFRMHSRLFKVSVETFDAIHYAGLTFYKIGIILLNLAPLIALWAVS